MGPIFKTPVAQIVPFDTTGTDFDPAADQVQEAVEQARKFYAPDVLVITTNGGVNNLQKHSPQTIVLEGSTAGTSLRFPPANSFEKTGHIYEIWNFSAVTIQIADSTGTLLANLRPNGHTSAFLRNNATAAGSWGLTYTVDNGNVFGTQIFIVSDETETSNNSGTVWLNKLTLTTPADLPLGDYLLNFQFIWRSSSANREADFRFQLNSSNIINWQPSTGRVQDRQLLSGFRRADGLSGANTWTFDFKFANSSTTIFVQQARMFVWRVA